MKKKPLYLAGASILLGLGVLAIAPRIIHVDYVNNPAIARLTLEDLYASLELYQMDMGEFPGTQDGLNALMESPNNDQRWRGPYRKKSIPKDPWGNDYGYQRLKKGFKLFTLGSDNQKGGSGEAQDIIIEYQTPK